MSAQKTFRRPVTLAFALGFAAAVGGQVLLNASALANQPFMEAALGALRQAQANLQKAEANKDGHRAKAMALVDQAIGEVQAGMAAAR